MNCPHCESWERGRPIGVFNTNCQECRIRELAKSQWFFYSGVSGKLHAKYLQQLEHEFGKGNAAAGHERVKSAWARIQEQATC